MAEEKKSITTKEVVGSSDSNPVKPKEFSCQFCDKKFFTRQGLGGHQNAHKREMSEAKKLKRKHDQDPLPRLTSCTFTSSQNEGVMRPSVPYLNSYPKHHCYHQTRCPSCQGFNRPVLNAAYSRLNIPIGEPPTGLREGHATAGANFLMWQRYYREKMAKSGEPSSVASLRREIPNVEEANNCVVTFSENEKKLDLSLHL